MTPERWQEVKHLLDESAAIPPTEWQGWLDGVCGDDRTLRRDVEAYLVHEDELDNFIADSPVDALLEAIDQSDQDEGRLMGQYRLDHLLGRGGMGAVYRAHREKDFDQKVALKLIRSGFETPRILGRFHNERRILARLEHPNIARLLDGGTTEDGRPFFVMELVEGVRIDEYCRQHRLPVRQRLELILQICDALQLAHRNLVIHRDLKPSNILVTSGSVPKLLDFGIGKLIEPEPRQDHTFYSTADGEGPLTLSYASPEQLFEQAVTTASDLYSLGVVMYELLTDQLPHGLDSANQAQVVQAVRDHEPVPPSLEVSDGAAGERRVALSALRRELRGDLDAIVLKSLAKDPRRRYASADQLAADLRRHLMDLPVEARPSTATYRAGKYIRRHRWGLAALTTIIGLILAFTIVLAR